MRNTFRITFFAANRKVVDAFWLVFFCHEKIARSNFSFFEAQQLDQDPGPM